MINIQFLAQWALRSSLLILCGALLLKALRVKDPSVRLAAWTAMLVASLAVPLLSVTVPAVPVITRTTAVAQAPLSYVAPARRVTAVPEEISVLAAPERFDWQRAAIVLYEAIAVILLLRLSLGLLMSWRLLRSSMPTPEAGVRESDRVSSPVTVGILRPVVLLPTDWRTWSAAKLAAVLAHERSHIRRHDPAVQVLSSLHRALLWYSPLSWYLDRQVVRLAEQASDDAAIAAVSDRASYAETLLEFMQRGVRRTLCQGVPMARYDQPERRIDRILAATTLSRGASRWTVAAIVALALPLAYVVAAVQERLTFEAASVKPTTVPPNIRIVDGMVVHLTVPGPDIFNTGGPGTTDPGRIHYPVIALRGLLKQAYEEYFDIQAPDWADTEIMAVDATMPPNTTQEQFRTMLQNLLIDRFALKTHVETKQITGYALTLAKDGPRFKESPPDNEPPPPFKDHKGADGFPVTDPHMRGIGIQFAPRERMRLVGPHASMTELSRQLGSLVDSVVKDATGLRGDYDLKLNFAGQMGGHRGGTALLQPPPPSDNPSAPDPFPDIFSALQSQLGLKLEKQKVSVEILVVEHLEKAPTAQ